jgi:hypothetical protein
MKGGSHKVSGLGETTRQLAGTDKNKKQQEAKAEAQRNKMHGNNQPVQMKARGRRWTREVVARQKVT